MYMQAKCKLYCVEWEVEVLLGNGWAGKDR